MKKSILITAMLAALAMLASCQKEQFTKNVTSATGVTEFTATIEQPTKTAISDEGKVTWVAGDTITVTDAAQKSAVYVASSAGASTTFTLKEGQEAVGDGPYTATYGDINNQKYDAAGANCPLTAPETSTTNFKFSSPYAVVKITAQSDGEEGETIRSVDVNYGENTYTLDCVTGVTLTSAGIDFFVSVEPATDVALSATFHTDDKTATKTRTEVVTLAAKDLLPVTLTFAADDWKSPEADTPEPLKGVFTVSDNGTPNDPSDDIKVRFSQGNLVATINESGTPTAWKFATNQYDYLGEDGANKTIGNTTTSGTAGDVDLFGWSTTSTTYGINTSTDNSNYSGNFVDWGKAYCESKSITPDNTWRTLSKDEWQYLFNSRSTTTNTGTTNARYAKATVNGKAGIILLPDTYTHPSVVTALTNINTNNAAFTVNTYDVTAWEAMESAGAVFLPAAGYRLGSIVYTVGAYGHFWSSTAYDENFAYIVRFNSDTVHPDGYVNRFLGFSVRLVTNVSAAPTPTEPSSDYVEIKALYNGTDSTSLKWYRQNLAITGSGNNPWKGKNSSAVKVPGTDKDVIVGDYFQWAAYENYALPENDLGNGKTDKGLLIYTSFTNKFCVDGGDEDKFVFKMAETNKEYYFNPSFLKEGYVCISPYYSGGYTKYISGSVNLDSSDDVARIILGDGWRMPTQAEFSAMKDATYWAWDGEDCGYYVFTPYVSTAAGQIGNIAGLDKSDALLFFPASGYGDSSDFTQASVVGYYWSGTLSDDTTSAHCLYFYNNDVDLQRISRRNYGHAIRPVSD